MKNFQKSWNDFMYMLRDAPGSNEILTEINNTKNKWKIEIGNEEFMKIEKDLDDEIELNKKFDKSENANFNKNDEGKISIIEKNTVTTNINITETETVIEKKEEIPISKKPVTVESSTEKKGFKKIKIVEEETEEDNETAKEKEEVVDEKLSNKKY